MVDTIVSEREGWLALHEATAKMGVSAATLRMWADEGRIESYRTPGGHRRFRLDESKTPFKKEGGRAEARWRLLENSAWGLVQNVHEAGGAAEAELSAQARLELRDLERALIRLCTSSLQKGEGEGDTRLLVLGEAYARWKWRYGLGLRDLFRLLASFRSAFLKGVVEFAFGLGEPDTDELNLWLSRANEIIDRVCLSMLEFRPGEPVSNARE